MADLISRAALLRDLSYCAPELWRDEEYIKAKIMKQHAVDAVLVVHGRWEREGFNIVCPFCDFEPMFNSTEPLYNYCPNCGAKMDGCGAKMDGERREYGENPDTKRE